MVGTATAWEHTGHLRWSVALVTALAAVLIQIGTNLYNDAADYHRGGDGPARVGPPRVTAQGLLGAFEVIRAALLCFVAAAVAGSYLSVIGGWPILVLGLLSIACGWAYSGGPVPIAYTPLGELFVVVFFGLVAVGGTYWLVAGAFALPPVVAGLMMGSFAAAVLLVNNHRDRDEDARVGRRTLAIAIGTKATRWLFAALMVAPFVLLAPFSCLSPNAQIWTAFLAVPVALAVIRQFVTEPPGPGLNLILVRTVQTQMIFAVLLTIGAAL